MAPSIGKLVFHIKGTSLLLLKQKFSGFSINTYCHYCVMLLNDKLKTVNISKRNVTFHFPLGLKFDFFGGGDWYQLTVMRCIIRSLSKCLIGLCHFRRYLQNNNFEINCCLVSFLFTVVHASIANLSLINGEIYFMNYLLVI